MVTNWKTLIRAARALAAGGRLALATAVPAAAGHAPRVMLPDPVGNRALSAWREAAQAQHPDGFEFDELALGALAGWPWSEPGRPRCAPGVITLR